MATVVEREAEAATVVVRAAGAAPTEDESPEVRIDCPFIFAIRDTRTGTVLFVGRATNSSAQSPNTLSKWSFRRARRSLAPGRGWRPDEQCGAVVTKKAVRTQLTNEPLF